MTLPAVGSYGKEYAAVLKELASSPERLPAFMCHYYNHYFAHTVRSSIDSIAVFLYPCGLVERGRDLRGLEGQAERNRIHA